MANATVAGQIDALVPPDRNIEYCDLKAIQQKGWSGQRGTPESRAMYWRICLGVVSNRMSSRWKLDLIEQVSDYRALQKEILPDISAMDADPLSHILETSSDESPADRGWDKYFQPKESLKLITADLDRLYLTGVDDEYFQSENRRKMLENILFIWSARHESVSYRQGMHEIAGTVLLVVEKELAGWDAEALNHKDAEALSKHPLRGCFAPAHVEPFTFWIFERIMKDLCPLYDPAVGADHQPAIVQYCTNIQENLLRRNDPELCDFLEGQFIQSQLYGMRWARLMLGREFSVTDTQVLRIWDYIFASCISFPEPVVETLDPLSVVSLASSNHADVLASRARYGPCNPLLAMLGNFMLAMLLHVREEIISGDVSTALALLMRFPPMDDVSPIVDYADMIRRGVLDPGAHMGRLIDGHSSPPVGQTSLSLDPLPRRELKVRLKEAATPMLSNMGRRVSKLVGGGSSSNGAESGLTFPYIDPLLGTTAVPVVPPRENLSKTNGLFSSLTKSMSMQKTSPNGTTIESLLSDADDNGTNKKSLFQSAAKKTNSSTVSELECRVKILVETQRFVGDSILEVIGDLERNVMSGFDGDREQEGNISIVKLKELVRVLYGELSIQNFSDNCCGHDPRAENISCPSSYSFLEKTAPEDRTIKVLDLPPPPNVSALDGISTPGRTRGRQSSVSELMTQSDSDDDAHASPRPLSKKKLMVKDTEHASST